MNREKFRRTYRYRNGKRSEKGREDYHVGRYRRAIAGGETGTFHVSYMKFAHEIRTRGSFFFSTPFYFLFAFVPLSGYARRAGEGRFEPRDKARMYAYRGRRSVSSNTNELRSTWPHKSVCHLSRCVYRPSFSPSRRGIFGTPPNPETRNKSGIESTVMKVSGVVTYANKSMGNVNFISHYSRRRDEIDKRDYVRERKDLLYEKCLV